MTQRLKRIILDRVDTTNLYLERQLASGDLTERWCLAHQQTAGVGRRGRAWVSDAGNFTASCLVFPALEIKDMPNVSFAAALGLREALIACGVPSEKISLKWPNDVLLKGRKLSGILLQSVRYGSQTGIIIGIGVNLATAPNETEIEQGATPPIALASVQENVPTPIDFLDALEPCFLSWVRTLEQEGFAPLRTQWLAHAKGVGAPIIARLPDREERGIFEDLDPTGALLLRTSKGVLALSAADIYFGPK